MLHLTKSNSVNREIKFRAFDSNKKVMISEGYHVIGEVTMFGIIDQYVQENRGEIPSLEYYNFIQESQYTGLKDKNGKEVYEGDILASPHYPANGSWHYLHHKVQWSDECNGLVAVSINNPEGESFKVHGNPQMWVYMKWEQPEIVGNIYENPELLNPEGSEATGLNSNSKS